MKRKKVNVTIKFSPDKVLNTKLYRAYRILKAVKNENSAKYGIPNIYHFADGVIAFTPFQQTIMDKIKKEGGTISPANLLRFLYQAVSSSIQKFQTIFIDVSHLFFFLDLYFKIRSSKRNYSSKFATRQFCIVWFTNSFNWSHFILI